MGLNGVMCVWVEGGLLFWVQAACFGPLFSQCIDVSLATDTRCDRQRSRDARWHFRLPPHNWKNHSIHISRCDWLIRNRHAERRRSHRSEPSSHSSSHKHWLSCGNWIVWIFKTAIQQQNLNKLNQSNDRISKGKPLQHQNRTPCFSI